MRQSKRKQVVDYLNRIYTPSAKRQEVKDLLAQLEKVGILEITPEYAGKCRIKVLLIEHKGVGPRETYASSGFYSADFGSVGETFADVCIHKDNGIIVKRFGVKRPNLVIVEDRF